MSDTKEIKISGGALITKKQRTRKRTSGGGLADSAASSATDPDVQVTASRFASSASAALGSLGPNKIQQFGGNSTGATVNLASTRAPTNAPSAPAPVPHVSGVSPSQPAPVSGGALVLTPPKRQTRISLKPKKGGSTALSNTPPQPGGGHTRKARKIHLGVRGVTARLLKAKKVKKQAMMAPISDIKAKLESAGVIKKSSKAPDTMLRTMYADLLITKKGL